MHARNITAYLAESPHIDHKTRFMIFNAIKPQDIFEELYIRFEQPDLLTNDLAIHSIDERIEGDADLVDPDHKRVQRSMLKDLYRFAALAGAEKLIGGILNYQSQRQGMNWVSRKFFNDHIGFGNRKLTEQRADSVAERRGPRIVISTLIPDAQLCDLNSEVEEDQEFYRLANEQITREANEREGIPAIKGIFFSTKNPYLLINRSSKHIPDRQKTSFYYSVCTDEEGKNRYMHHFEGIGIKPEWITTTLKERQVYYMPH